MREAPEVTVVDPHHARPLPPAPRVPLSTHRDRVLALLCLVLALLGVVQARHLRARTAEALTATALGLTVSVQEEGVLRLEVRLGARTQERILSLAADHGWRPAAPRPATTGEGVLVPLQHPVSCTASVALPERLTVRTATRTQRVEVRAPDGLRVEEGCDPFGPDDRLRVVASTVARQAGRTTVRTDVVNLSTQPQRVAEVAFPGFAFTSSRPLPLELPGRDRSQRPVLDQLAPVRLLLDAEVVACGTARAALDNALQSARPDLARLVLAEGAAQVDVPGLATYLEQQWQAACVR